MIASSVELLIMKVYPGRISRHWEYHFRTVKTRLRNALVN
jgi:hypothetical protein